MIRFPFSRRAVLAVLLATAAAPCSFAATTPGEPKDVALRLTATGTVTAIDPDKRLLKLRGKRGEATYRLDPKVANLQDLKVGERVKIDYVAALVLTLKRGGAAMRAEAEKEAESRAGNAPGAVVPAGTTVIARVLAVDRAKRTVRLQGPEGRTSDMNVQDPADLVGVRPGDQVAAVLYEAVVVGVEPAPR